jgi:hypothetical protein
MTEPDRKLLKGTGAGAEVLAVSIPEAQRVSGLSRSEIYRQLGLGNLKAVKAGARTLLLMASLRDHLASLPPATFRAPSSKAA